MFFSALFFLLLGSLTSWLVIYLFLYVGLGQGSEQPQQYHHTHVGLVPRIGGLGIICGFALTYLLCFFYLDHIDNKTLVHYGIFLGALLAFLLGFVDDFHPLGAKFKLLAQVLIGVIVHECGIAIEKLTIPFTGDVLELGLLSMGLTVFWFVAIMNLINLIDGLDGLAGGIGLMLLSLLAFEAFQGGGAISLILSLGMVGAVLGFLFHNFPPAKAYMGDSGAYLIGFVIAALSLINSEKGTILAALIAPILALALPIADVTYAMCRRAISGLPIFRPDKQHIHHRLIRSGFSGQKAVLLLYGISLFALIGALLLFSEQGRFFSIFLGFAFVIILFAIRGRKINPRTFQTNLVNSMSNRQDTLNAIYLKKWLITEVERADTGNHFWSDYKFILRKMGICRAEMEINGQERSYFLPDTNHDNEERLWHESHQIADNVRINLYAEKDNFSEEQFILIADIAAEAWSGAANKWAAVNGGALNFESEARPAKDYREQKSRNLYRPTY